MSSYEEYILSILKKERIKFYREKTFTDCRGGKYRYDFYLPRPNGEQIIIEVDGQYHFHPIRGDSNLRAQKERDRIKNSYCLAHKIKLYRIPYWEINNIKCFNDMLNSKFLVLSKWHNDYLKTPT